MAHSEQVLTARRAGLVACRHCGRVSPPQAQRCGTCGSTLASRYPRSLQRVWAWWIAGIIAYIPANIYPMMITDTLFQTMSATIVGGAVELITHGDAFVGIVVLVASVVIPVGKFIAIAWIALAIQLPGRRDPHKLHKLHSVVEFIGRWSMIDVFVVAILSALVQIGSVAAILPGFAAICFGGSVIFTMLSALSLDPRLIWDALEERTRDEHRPERA